MWDFLKTHTAGGMRCFVLELISPILISVSVSTTISLQTSALTFLHVELFDSLTPVENFLSASSCGCCTVSKMRKTCFLSLQSIWSSRGLYRTYLTHSLNLRKKILSKNFKFLGLKLTSHLLFLCFFLGILEFRNKFWETTYGYKVLSRLLLGNISMNMVWLDLKRKKMCWFNVCVRECTFY